MKPAPMMTRGSGLPLWLAVGYFILRAPVQLARSELPLFLARVAAQPREDADFVRVARISRRWLRQPGLRGRNTCYLRSLVLFRFVNPRGRDLCLHFGVDEPTATDHRQHGHSWITLDGVPWNAPSTMAEGRLHEIYRYSTVSGGSSTSGATAAAAMIQRGVPVPGNGAPQPGE